VENEIFAPYIHGTKALERLLFLRCVQSVKLYTWEDGEAKPRLYFSLDIENIKRNPQIATMRRDIINWLKAGMNEVERQEKGEVSQAVHGASLKEDNTFYRYFESVAKNGTAATAPRHLIPLTIHTKRSLPSGGWDDSVDHFLVSTTFGTNEDVQVSVSAETKKYKQCLVPFVAVSSSRLVR
jgi:hypothetical protein